MYVMHKHARIALQPDSTWRETHPAETRTFATAMGMLRHCLREKVFAHHTGGRKYPATPGDLYLGAPGQRTYGLVDTFTRWEVTYEHVEAMRRAKAAYDARIHYLREIEPEWRPDPIISDSGVIHFADNSVELYEVSKYGQRRRRMVVAPGGDACF